MQEAASIPGLGFGVGTGKGLEEEVETIKSKPLEEGSCGPGTQPLEKGCW